MPSKQRARHVDPQPGRRAPGGPWHKRYFIEGVGAGVFASLLANPSSDAVPGVANALRRLRAAVAQREPLDIAALLDGEDISGRYLLIEALNLRYVGPNLHLAHDSQPGDGQFDVVLVRETERERLLHYLQLEWTGFPLHIDDKLRPKTKVKPSKMAGMVETRIGAHSVEFLVP